MSRGTVGGILGTPPCFVRGPCSPSVEREIAQARPNRQPPARVLALLAGHLRNRAGYCVYMDKGPCTASCIDGNAWSRVVAAPCNDTRVQFGAWWWGRGPRVAAARQGRGAERVLAAPRFRGLCMRQPHKGQAPVRPELGRESAALHAFDRPRLPRVRRLDSVCGRGHHRSTVRVFD